MTVRSRTPWPLRWLLVALVLGLSAALGMWGFEFGRGIAGLDRDAQAELTLLREDVVRLRAEHERAISVANSADSLLKAAQATQESLTARVKSLEAENLALTRDLRFFEKLMPAHNDNKPVAVRGVQAQVEAPGRLRYQGLLMQAVGRTGSVNGRYEVLLSGLQDGKPWSLNVNKSTNVVDLKQYQRLEGVIDYPAAAMVKQLEIKVLDAAGKLLASEVARL